MRVRRRFLDETPLTCSGGYLKTFWTGWQLGTGQSGYTTRNASIVADNTGGLVELAMTTSHLPGEVASDLAHVAARVTETTRLIVDETTVDEKCFLDVTFSFAHVGDSTSIIDVFSDTESPITLELGNLEAKLVILGEVIPVNNFSSMLLSKSASGSTSRLLRYRLYSRNTKSLVVGTRRITNIRAVLSDNTNTFNASRDCSLFYRQNWQYESRLQTRS